MDKTSSENFNFLNFSNSLQVAISQVVEELYDNPIFQFLTVEILASVCVTDSAVAKGEFTPKILNQNVIWSENSTRALFTVRGIHAFNGTGIANFLKIWRFKYCLLRWWNLLVEFLILFNLFKAILKLYYVTFYPGRGGGTQVYCRKQEKDERGLCFLVSKTAIFKKICIFFKNWVPF